jgi:ABC-2 family transporter protein
MSFLVWRQYRWQAAFAALVLAVFAAVLIITGLQMAAQWHTILSSCTASGRCGYLHQGQTSLGSVLGHDFAILSMLGPAVFGMLVGAPLLAREYEARTMDFAWAQSVTRARWLLVKVGWVLLAAAVWGGVLAELVTWWSGPRNAAFQNWFQPNYFDQQGIVPIGYSVFATALGITAGALFRRTLPAVAIVVGGFIGLRVWLSQDVRIHYMTPVTTYYSMTGNFNPAAGSLLLNGGIAGPNGQVLGQNFNSNAPVFNGVPISSLPRACQSLASLASQSAQNAANRCLAAAGDHNFVTYQPASRYWAFQGIETGIYLALALVLLAVTYVVVTRRDA